MNAASVAIAAIVTTAVLAVVWALLENRPDRTRLFLGLCVAALGLSVVAALAVQTLAELERTVSFVTPLAAIQFGVTGLLTPLAVNLRPAAGWITVPLLLIVIGLGAVFASDGDQQSGRLTLPERTSSASGAASTVERTYLV